MNSHGFPSYARIFGHPRTAPHLDAADEPDPAAAHRRMEARHKNAWRGDNPSAYVEDLHLDAAGEPDVAAARAAMSARHNSEWRRGASTAPAQRTDSATSPAAATSTKDKPTSSAPVLRVDTDPGYFTAEQTARLLRQDSADAVGTERDGMVLKPWGWRAGPNFVADRRGR